MPNQVYSLIDGCLAERPATPEELETAREVARAKVKDDPANYSIRSCWNCNGAHKHFLKDTSDGFLFVCGMGCGRWYYNGIDITTDEE